MRKPASITLASLALILMIAGAHAARSQTMSTPDQPPYSIYLPGIFSSEPPYDMARFMTIDVPGGFGPLYEVRHNTGSQARHQTQVTPDRFYHTKGENVAEWEELWIKNDLVYRGTDTSPGNGEYYTLYADDAIGTPAGSAWSPRFWRVGDIYERNPYVVFYRKSDCGAVPGKNGFQPSWLRFEAYYPTYTFKHNVSGLADITLSNVVELSWLLQLDGEPEERYFYAESYGLVGWSSRDGKVSAISEIHGPGERPPNEREEIKCLNRASNWLRPNSLLHSGLLPLEYRVK